jgi:uncharacterized protein DUF6459
MVVSERAAAVVPVVDYEPCPVPTTGAVPRHRPAPRSRVTRHHSPYVAHNGQPTDPTDTFRAAAAFTDAALRSVLEVIDARRPPSQLRGMLPPGLIDSVLVFARRHTRREAAAVLRRVRLQATGPAEDVFEVAAAYTRGERRHAIAARVQKVTALQGATWSVVALHIG